MTGSNRYALTGLNRYGLEVRVTLDLVAQTLWRLHPEGGVDLRVVSASEDLSQDLEDRLGNHFRIGGADADTTVYLLGLELDASARLLEDDAGDRVVVAFRNRLSHKSLLYRDYRGLSFVQLERRMRDRFSCVRSTGVMAPQRLAWNVAASVANRLQRFDYGYYLQDRSHLSPLHRGWSRYVCPIGVVAGNRRR